MSVDNVSNAPPPALTPLSSTSQTGDAALSLGDLSGLKELSLITMITVSISKVINTACSGPFQNLMTENQHQQYTDQAWVSAINAAVAAQAPPKSDGTSADGSTKITLPESVTLADGTTSYLSDYLAERPNLKGYLTGDPNSQASAAIKLYQTALDALSQTPIMVPDYLANINLLTSLINTYGDPSQMPAAPPAFSMDAYTSDTEMPQEYLNYAHQLVTLFKSQNIANNPTFLYDSANTVTLDNSQNLTADINSSATNFMTAIQQLTNTINNLVSALAAFCAAMAKCQQNVLKPPGS